MALLIFANALASLFHFLSIFLFNYLQGGSFPLRIHSTNAGFFLIEMSDSNIDLE